MAETFAQRTRVVNAALRRLRVAYRKADSAGEKLERELDRLIARKTIVSPTSLVQTTALLDEYVRAINAMDVPFADVLRLASSYV
jgi:hypothetical protein